jgi:hypothetical protein
MPSKRVTKRCRLYWLTNSVLVYEPKWGGGGGGVAGISANDYTGAQINFEDLTLTLPEIFCISSKGLLAEHLLNFSIFST